MKVLKFYHKTRQEVLDLTEAAKILNEKNPDPSTIFLYSWDEKDVIEVSKVLVEQVNSSDNHETL